MSPTDAPDPVRTCVGCRRRRPIATLVRVTRSGDDVIFGGPSDGRGAWLCASDSTTVDATCLDRAIGQRAFARAWRSDVDSELVARIRERIGSADGGEAQ